MTPYITYIIRLTLGLPLGLTLVYLLGFLVGLGLYRKRQ